MGDLCLLYSECSLAGMLAGGSYQLCCSIDCPLLNTCSLELNSCVGYKQMIQVARHILYHNMWMKSEL